LIVIPVDLDLGVSEPSAGVLLFLPSTYALAVKCFVKKGYYNSVLQNVTLGQIMLTLSDLTRSSHCLP